MLPCSLLNIGLFPCSFERISLVFEFLGHIFRTNIRNLHIFEVLLAAEEQKSFLKVVEQTPVKLLPEARLAAFFLASLSECCKSARLKGLPS